ncbi:hypothetical protein S40285_10352 [Stachybotrys chlorohalonatus IBT 40285]|uniref:Uncharacterized protein n=1 Tax=Stachybotrys chlorohalonatus (strain IBT 40285) TaxID=1283841 RepID=A0A084QVF8_STAC4|nr:hypothetical protein S40285_10352 [Stachybotrys chlorohalonata IBT 40285]
MVMFVVGPLSWARSTMALFVPGPERKAGLPRFGRWHERRPMLAVWIGRIAKPSVPNVRPFFAIPIWPERGHGRGGGGASSPNLLQSHHNNTSRPGTIRSTLKAFWYSAVFTSRALERWPSHRSWFANPLIVKCAATYPLSTPAGTFCHPSLAWP